MNAKHSASTFESLLDGVRRGRSGGMYELLVALQPFVVTVAQRLATNVADAEEIAQDSLIAVLHNLDGFAGGARLQSWVFAIVRSQVGRKYRRMRPLPESACASAWTEPQGGHDAAAACELHDDLAGALAGSSLLDRRIVLCRDVARLVQQACL